MEIIESQVAVHMHENKGQAHKRRSVKVFVTFEASIQSIQSLR